MGESDISKWQPFSIQGEKEPRLYVEIVPFGGREEVSLLETISFEEITNILGGISNEIGKALVLRRSRTRFDC